MEKTKKDPLLATAKVVLVIAEVLLVFSMVMVAIGLGAVLTVQRGEILADIAAAGAPMSTYFATIVVLLLVAALLFLSLCFVIQLKRIVESVGLGDPFEPANAARLTRMAWYALGAQACELVIAPIISAYAQYAEAFKAQVDAGDSSLTGLALAIVLFILARVFRHGAAMREDLEGTV